MNVSEESPLHGLISTPTHQYFYYADRYILYSTKLNFKQQLVVGSFKHVKCIVHPLS